ncbi:MAG TPA: diguanylate cyclase [Bacillota bacterium]|nr:diguanylate cyclase [Bacillota bacterium]
MDNPTLTQELDLLKQNLEQMERKVQETQQRLENIITGADVGTWEWNVQTGELMLSERWAEIVGFTLEELQPITIDTWMRLAHPEDLKQSNQLLGEHFSGALPYYDLELRVRHKDGRWVWVQDRGKVTRWDAEGRPLMMFGTHTDINQRKLVEEERNRLITAIEQAAESIIITDTRGDIQYVNPAVEGITGYSMNETLGQNPRFLKSGFMRPEVYTTLWLTITQGKVWEGEFVNKKKDGSLYYEEARITPIRNSKSEIVNYLAVKYDITEKKAVEQSLKRSQDLLNLFFEQSLDSFFFMMLDEPVDWRGAADQDQLLDYIFHNMKVTRVNSAMLLQYRTTEEEIIGKRPGDFSGHSSDYGKAMWRDLLTSGKVQAETMGTRFDGSRMTVKGDYICIYDEEGRISGCFGIQRDVTEERMAVKALEESEEKFRQLAIRLNEVAIRDPLTNIYNRRYVFQRLREINDRFQRTGNIYSVAILDVDHFKNINDSHGHQVGDYILRELSRIVLNKIRSYDLLGRYGGEEFVIVFTDTEKEAAFIIMERILNAIREKVFVCGEREVAVTFSCGVADASEIEREYAETEHIIAVADKKLYQAKNYGRNRIIY